MITKRHVASPLKRSAYKKLRYEVRFLFLCSAALFSMGVAYAVLATPIPLVEAVKKSPGIYHVKVLKTEIPFKDEGTNTIRLAYCKVIATLKESSDQPIVPAQFEGPFHLIVSLLRPAGFSPIGEGNECIIFCNTGGLTPTLVGESRIYHIEGKMITAYAADFPDPKLTKTEIETLSKDSAYKAKRIKMPLKTFLDRVTKLQAQTSTEQNE